MFFLTGCTTTKPDTSRTSSVFVSCSGKFNCPIPEERKQGIVAELRESGHPKAQELADAIESGKTKLYELNDKARKILRVPKDAIATPAGNDIFIDTLNTAYSDKELSVWAMHEYGHILTSRAGTLLVDAPTRLIHERNAFTLQSEYWETLKNNSFFLLKHPDFNFYLNHWKNGTLDDVIKKRYGINIERYLEWKKTNDYDADDF